MSTTRYELEHPPTVSFTEHAPPTRRWSPISIAGLIAAWVVLQVGGLFSPGLLDDVDSIYIQIAREMLQRHDFVTPTIDGIRFFDKPPLMYWMAAGSMHLFGIHDWAARIPLALGVLALLLAVYALGIRLFSDISSPDYPDRGGLYAALAMATSIGPYLYTRFYIPDILVALWMTLSIHLFLIALDRIAPKLHDPSSKSGGPSFATFAKRGVSSVARPLSSKSPLLPMLGFGAVLALSVLTKGLIGIVFPIGFVIFYLAITRQLHLLLKLQIPAATAAFLLIAAPWHILAALRNPAIAMPPGVGLPAHAGWAWFYLYNEHIARFLSRRIPHDYGQTPIWLFWLLAILWMMPWAAFLPAALKLFFPQLKRKTASSPAQHEAALTLSLWAFLVLGFFTLSARQEYYSLPALPAVALLVGGALAWADRQHASATNLSIRRWSLWLLVPLTTVVATICGYFAITAPTPAPGVDLNRLLSSNPDMYNLSLGHVYDLTGQAMGLFRGPLITVALGMLLLGPVAYFVRRDNQTLAANLIVAIGMTSVLLAAHEGLVRFYPILGSKDLALAIDHVRKPGDHIFLDGELTYGSTLIFYTGQPMNLVNGHVNGPWYGSFWPDSPHMFETNDSLHHAWAGPDRIFLMVFDTKRADDLRRFGPVYTLESSGGKTILSNRP